MTLDVFALLRRRDFIPLFRRTSHELCRYFWIKLPTAHSAHYRDLFSWSNTAFAGLLFPF